MKTCPICKGTRKVSAFVERIVRSKSGLEEVWCFTCDGAGKVPDNYEELVAKGKRLRDDREARGISLREEARRLGISVVELSRRERGKE